MRRYVIILLFGICSFINAQSAKGPKIGYFDMNKILQSVPEFAEANNQLELRAQNWKTEIDQKQAQINLLREELKTERILLTKELIEEKEDEISFLEKELSAYQQKRFGPLGDLFTQKSVLVKPIQDQVFSIVNDIATRRKYDFVFDMSSASNGLIFANRRFDMNDEIINAIMRSSKRDQSERKKISKEEEQKEDDKKYDPDLKEKQEQLDKKTEDRKQRQQDLKGKRDKQREEQKNRTKSPDSDAEENTETSQKMTKAERDEALKLHKQKILEDRKQKREQQQESKTK